MANLPTRLGKPPYTGWQNHFCIWLNVQDFLPIFFVYKSFYKFLLQVFLQPFSYYRAVESLFMKTIIHYFMYSLIHELNSS